MKNIIATLNQLEQQLAQLNPEDLLAIERDIALEKMRSLYEKILTAEVVIPEVQEEALEDATVVVPIVDVPIVDAPAEEPIEESVIELIEDIIDEVEQLPEDEDDEPAEEVEEDVEEEVEVEAVEEPVNEDAESVEEQEEEVVEEPVEEPIEELVEEPIEEPIEEPVAPKSKIDHKVVLSLYDDDYEEPAADDVEELEEPAEEEVEESEDEVPVIDFVIEEPIEEEVAEEEVLSPVQEAPYTVVLADVLGGEQTTLADTMVATQTPDVATVAAAATTSLMKSVNINDKILLTRDLFAGSSELYEQAMEVLDSYESLDEAMLFIYDNFDWNPNSEGAKLLVDLLMRKLL